MQSCAPCEGMRRRWSPARTITSRVLPAQRHAYKASVPRRPRLEPRCAHRQRRQHARLLRAALLRQRLGQLPIRRAVAGGRLAARARAAHVATPCTSPSAVASLHVPPLRSAMTEAGRTSRSGMAVMLTAHEPAPASRSRGAAPARRPPPRRACRAAARAARARAAPPRTGAAAPAGPARTARRGVQGVSQRSVAKPRMQRQQT